MLAVSTYNAYLVVHVAAATLWLGGGFILSVLGSRIARENDPRRMAAFARDAEWVGNRLFLPAGLVVLAFGFLLIWEGPWTFDELWIQLGLGLFGLTFLTGALGLGPQAGKIAKLIEQHGVEAPEVGRQIRVVLFISRLDLITLYSVIVVMVAKPTSDDTLLFAVWAAVLAVIVVSLIAGRRPEATAA